jgi:hypothetical protein
MLRISYILRVNPSASNMMVNYGMGEVPAPG